MASIALAAASMMLIAAQSPTRFGNVNGTQSVAMPARQAGILHLPTGTWSHGASLAAVGPHVIYNNTCPSYGLLIAALELGESVTDEGRVPSPGGPNGPTVTKPGCAESHLVNGFEIAYCTDEATLDARVSFIESYTPYCTNPANFPTLAAFDLIGLPGSGTPGVQVCWTVTIDLGTPPDPGNLAFTLRADGDGTWNPPSAGGNRFGVTFQNLSAPGTNYATGPLMAGDYTFCRGYDGTLFDPIPNYAELGTGMDTIGGFYLQLNTGVSGCYSCCNPLDSIYLRLFSTGCPSEPGTYFCFGDGTGTACPCNNHSAVDFKQGCTHGSSANQGPGGHIRGYGNASLSADTLHLYGSGIPQQTSVLFFQGSARTNGGQGSVFGDGKRCAGGSITRLGAKTDPGGGAVSYPEASDPPISVRGQITAPGLRTYQLWYRNASNFCTSATFNLSNGYEVLWQP